MCSVVPGLLPIDLDAPPLALHAAGFVLGFVTGIVLRMVRLAGDKGVKQG
eukprot:SAG22_NODE_1866_length_3405_cov_5.505594_3_plen_50_part_00